MPMHIPSNIDAGSSSIATLFSRAGPIASPLSPTTHSDILGILQREQDYAMSLLSLSPLLSSLFISYANRAAALESACATPSSDGEERKELQAAITILQEENEKLKLENGEVAGKLEAAAASQEAFRSQVSSLKEANATQQDDIKTLRAELVEAKDMYNRLVEDSSAERAALQLQFLDLEARREELKEAVVEQQIKISKFERQGFNCLSNHPNAATSTETTGACKLSNPGDRITASVFTGTTETRLEQEAREQAEKAAREEMDNVARRRAEEAAKRAEQEAKEKAEREAKERAEARVKAEKSAKQKALKEAKEKAEREARERAERDAKERAEQAGRGRRGAEPERLKREGKETVEKEEKEKAERKDLSPVPRPATGWNTASSPEEGTRRNSASAFTPGKPRPRSGISKQSDLGSWF